MGKIRSFFSVDNHYKEEVRNYTRIDGIIAIVYYVFLMVAYFSMGQILLKKQIYLGVVVNLLLVLVCILIVLLRKQKLSSLGITKEKLKNSIILGSFLGGLFLVFNGIIPVLFSKRELISADMVLYNIFYYFVIIGFVEELIFRGFIQTRLYGIIKNDFLAIIIAGVMFSLMHIPFQMSLVNMRLFQYFSENILQLIILVGWHVFFNFLYKKYNSIFTGTIVHGFMNFSSNLFR
ncbi:CPBP family intramembrane glutamic endopeptidase [Alloiococcus sp. CFN-8]|uniref:CPBP family intramembrane glutamic endopeptidase n=1 Tax=Alloiococcus sp. CFN-8 TaxID=3416081 RepID=UPI003CED243B